MRRGHGHRVRLRNVQAQVAMALDEPAIVHQPCFLARLRQLLGSNESYVVFKKQDKSRLLRLAVLCDPDDKGMGSVVRVIDSSSDPTPCNGCCKTYNSRIGSSVRCWVGQQERRRRPTDLCEARKHLRRYTT